MAEPKTKIDPRAKRAVMQLAAKRRYESGQPPSPAVEAALKGFQGPPSPEQVSQMAMQLARTQGPAAAIEFEEYARRLLIERATPAAQQAAAADRPPAAEVQAALHSFKNVPSDQEIEAKAAEIAQRSPELAAQFKAYAEQLRSDVLARQEGQYSERDLQTLESDFPERAAARNQPEPQLPEVSQVRRKLPERPAQQPTTVTLPERSALERAKAALRPLMPWEGYFKIQERLGIDTTDEKTRLNRSLERDKLYEQKRKEESGGRT